MRRFNDKEHHETFFAHIENLILDNYLERNFQILKITEKKQIFELEIICFLIFKR